MIAWHYWWEEAPRWAIRQAADTGQRWWDGRSGSSTCLGRSRRATVYALLQWWQRADSLRSCVIGLLLVHARHFPRGRGSRQPDVPAIGCSACYGAAGFGVEVVSIYHLCNPSVSDTLHQRSGWGLGRAQITSHFGALTLSCPAPGQCCTGPHYGTTGSSGRCTSRH